MARTDLSGEKASKGRKEKRRNFYTLAKILWEEGFLSQQERARLEWLLREEE